MNIEKQVCSQKISKALYDLGITARSEFSYVKRVYNGETVVTNNYGLEDYEYDSAFTVAELGVMLPEDLYIPYKGGSGKKRKRPQHLHCFKMDRYQVNYTGGGSRERLTQQGNTEAEARASMLIYLLENKLTTPEEVNNRLNN